MADDDAGDNAPALPPVPERRPRASSGTAPRPPQVAARFLCLVLRLPWAFGLLLLGLVVQVVLTFEAGELVTMVMDLMELWLDLARMQLELEELSRIPRE